MKTYQEYMDYHHKKEVTSLRYYVIIPKESARKFVNINTFNDFKEWSDKCLPPLMMFEGTATDEMFMPDNYDYIILTNPQQVWYFIYSHYYLKHI